MGRRPARTSGRQLDDPVRIGVPAAISRRQFVGAAVHARRALSARLARGRGINRNRPLRADHGQHDEDCASLCADHAAVGDGRHGGHSRRADIVIDILFREGRTAISGGDTDIVRQVEQTTGRGRRGRPRRRMSLGCDLGVRRGRWIAIIGHRIGNHRHALFGQQHPDQCLKRVAASGTGIAPASVDLHPRHDIDT